MFRYITKRGCSALAAGLLFLGISGAAHAHPALALAFQWSFTSELDDAGKMVRGTISGLSEGQNDGSGLDIMVTDTPDGQGIPGGPWVFFGTAIPNGDAFTVTDGIVTFADAF